jgi:hypothetical protein
LAVNELSTSIVYRRDNAGHGHGFVFATFGAGQRPATGCRMP